MALTAEQQRLRADKLTASQIGALMSGDADKIMNLWKLHIGDPSYAEPDLTWVWPVRLGEFTEALNLLWYEHKHGKISRMGEVVYGNPDWMAATLDSWDDERKCPLECKTVGGRESLETVTARYMPQMHWQMMVTGASECAFSVISLPNEPIVEYIPRDAAYCVELMSRAEQFMRCVESLTPPVAMPAIAAPVVAAKIYDMSSSNSWAEFAGLWCNNKTAAEVFNNAAKELKTLMPADAAKAYGHNITLTRNRAGSLTIKGDTK